MPKTIKLLGNSNAESNIDLLVPLPSSPSISGPEAGEADPIHVLIVEDDENYHEIVSSELAWHGFAVNSFANGDALLGALDAAEADVIVLDWRLPTISGIDLLLQLRRRGVNVPLVFLTSHAQPANEQLAFQHGARGFIDKTRGVEALASRLRQVAQAGKLGRKDSEGTEGYLQGHACLIAAIANCRKS